MRDAVARAARFGVAIGAHPSYPDPANFGRVPARAARPTSCARRSPRSSTRSSAAGADIRYVKPHGALYHAVIADRRAGRRRGGRGRRPLAPARAAACPILGLDGEIAARQPPRPDCRSCARRSSTAATARRLARAARRARGAARRPARRRGARGAPRARGCGGGRRRHARSRRTRHPSACTATRLPRSRWPAPCAPRSTTTGSRCARRGDALRVLPMGDRALLARGRLARRRARAARGARGDPAPPGSSTSSRRRGRCSSASTPACSSLAAARAWIAAARGDGAAPAARTGRDEVVLDIVYDGADLDETAALLGRLAGRHSPSSTPRRAGRSRSPASRPGFGYLVSPDWPYDVPRLDVAAHPRARGRGRARGRVHRRLSARDPGRLAAHRHDVGAPVRSGCRVPGAPRAGNARAVRPAGPRRRASRESADRARAVDSRESGAGRQRERGPRMATSGGRARGIRVLEPGLLATLQDLGRPGAASLGVSPSGALDRGALRTANRLRRQPRGRRGHRGHDGRLPRHRRRRPLVRRDRRVGPDPPRRAARSTRTRRTPGRAGEELHLDWFGHGARAYLAVRGGLDGRAVARLARRPTCSRGSVPRRCAPATS